MTANDPDGGVVMADQTDIFMFEAPETGYTPSIKLRYGPDGCDEFHGDLGASLRFFSRSHNSRWYAANQYAFFIPDQDGSVTTTMRFWRNPGGSRNLEHDGAHPLPEPRLTEAPKDKRLRSGFISEYLRPLRWQLAPMPLKAVPVLGDYGTVDNPSRSRHPFDSRHARTKAE